MNLFSWLKPKKKLSWEEQEKENLKLVSAKSTKEDTDRWIKHELESQARSEKIRKQIEEEARLNFPDTAERNLLYDIQTAAREKKYQIEVYIGNQYGNANVVVERMKNRGFDVTELMQPTEKPEHPLYRISWENK